MTNKSDLNLSVPVALALVCEGHSQVLYLYPIFIQTPPALPTASSGIKGDKLMQRPDRLEMNTCNSCAFRVFFPETLKSVGQPVILLQVLQCMSQDLHMIIARGLQS